MGNGISKIYKNLHPNVRVIGPNPAYPTHSSAEAAHADRPHITYSLDPRNGWTPNLEELEQKIHDHPEIGGILIVNPDNPTGYVYQEDMLRKIVDIAKRHDLFIITDEIYSNLTYGTKYKKLAAVIGDVPAIAMRGISKEFPWPGGRCGWIEFYNRDKDEDFNIYCKSLIDAKMLEVCSTTLPQQILPQVMSDERYYPMLQERTEAYAQKAQIAHDTLSSIPGVIITKPNGAFYMTLVFDEGVLTENQTLPKHASIVADTPNENGDYEAIYAVIASLSVAIMLLNFSVSCSRTVKRNPLNVELKPEVSGTTQIPLEARR